MYNRSSLNDLYPDMMLVAGFMNVSYFSYHTNQSKVYFQACIIQQTTIIYMYDNSYDWPKISDFCTIHFVYKIPLPLPGEREVWEFSQK